jgi:hypothetical protein
MPATFFGLQADTRLRYVSLDNQPLPLPSSFFDCSLPFSPFTERAIAEQLKGCPSGYRRIGAQDLFTGLQDRPFLFLKTARRNYVSSMISGPVLSSDERLRRTSTTKGMNNLKSRGFFSDFSARVPAPARPISPNVAHFALTFPPRG